MKKDFISLLDYSTNELNKFIELAEKIKRDPKDYRKSLRGNSLGMIFTKSSTRTRISFEVGIFQLGGQGLYLGANDLQLARGETIYDTAKVLSRYLDGIMIRTYSHNDVVELAKESTIPVINGLTDYNHPCQVMADLLTIKEKKKKLEGLTLAYVGDGNNMTRSLLFGCMRMGMNVNVVCPKGYDLEEELAPIAEKLGKEHKCHARFTSDMKLGMEGVDVVYTDTWTSMGQENEREKRLKDLAAYEVNDHSMAYAKKDAIFLHCLPCHRGEEVSASVIDGPQSCVFDEAENRLHAQKAIMYKLMKD